MYPRPLTPEDLQRRRDVLQHFDWERANGVRSRYESSVARPAATRWSSVTLTAKKRHVTRTLLRQ